MSSGASRIHHMNLEAFKLHYLTHIEAMDEEHISLLRLMNQINDEVESGKRSEAGTSLLELQELLVNHFRHEEVFMEEVKFPFLKPHKDSHELIRIELGKLARSFMNNSQQRTAESLSRMLIDHVDHYDRQYGDFCKNRS